VYLQDCVIGDQDIAKLVHSMLEYTVLGDTEILTEIQYDPDIRNSVVPKDVEFVKDYYEMSNESEADLLRLSRYVLLIELDQKMCYDKKNSNEQNSSGDPGCIWSGFERNSN
jgi:DNA-directed RNA polymerase II subunit RPB1